MKEVYAKQYGSEGTVRRRRATAVANCSRLASLMRRRDIVHSYRSNLGRLRGDAEKGSFHRLSEKRHEKPNAVAERLRKDTCGSSWPELPRHSYTRRRQR
jgi:hypothetical protein